ncbi:hypothetical protein YZOS03_15430 [Vibrio alginolyticus]|nr:hypothetical protein YZOS03_15430 [Vibrio alginolyticus]
MTTIFDQQVSDSDREFLKIVEERFIHIFDVFNEGLFYMDEFGTMVFYNKGFYEQLGINAGRISLEQWLDLVHPLRSRKTLHSGRCSHHYQQHESHNDLPRA